MGKKYIYLSLAVILLFLFYVLPDQSLAADPVSTTPPSTTVGAQTPTPITLSNPISTLDPRVLIGKIVKGILALLGSIALLIFVWSGFTLIISRGNADKVKSSINSITWAILGIGLCLISYIIINQIIKTLTG